jgi:hypothetical protein
MVINFKDIHQFLDENFVRKKPVFEYRFNFLGGLRCHDTAWEVSDRLVVYCRVQGNGLIKTLFFIKDVGVVRKLEFEDSYNYTKVSLDEEERVDYMRQTCTPHEYNGSGFGCLKFELAGGMSNSRKRVVCTRRNDQFSYYVENE